jgi:hypothetical protein
LLSSCLMMHKSPPILILGMEMEYNQLPVCNSLASWDQWPKKNFLHSKLYKSDTRKKHIKSCRHRLCGISGQYLRRETDWEKQSLTGWRDA